MTGQRADRAGRRFPQWVHGTGEEPDPRFSLANERTFLAWIRTSLALTAAGVALAALDVPSERGLRLASAAVLIACGLLASVQAWFGWARSQRALRRRLPLPGLGPGPAISAGAALAGVLLLIGLWSR